MENKNVSKILLFISAILLVGLGVWIGQLVNKPDMKVLPTNIGYETCILNIRSDYERNLESIKSTYADCVKSGVCTKVDPEMLESIRIGENRALQNLEDGRRACDLKYTH